MEQAELRAAEVYADMDAYSDLEVGMEMEQSSGCVPLVGPEVRPRWHGMDNPDADPFEAVDSEHIFNVEVRPRCDNANDLEVVPARQ